MTGEIISLFDQDTAPSDPATGQPAGIRLAPPAGWPEPPAADAFHSLPGAIVEKIAPHTEADPAAILAQLLVCCGALIGCGLHLKVEATVHHPHEFVVLGSSSRSRLMSAWQLRNEPLLVAGGRTRRAGGAADKPDLRYRRADDGDPSRAAGVVPDSPSTGCLTAIALAHATRRETSSDPPHSLGILRPAELDLTAGGAQSDLITELRRSQLKCLAQRYAIQPRRMPSPPCSEQTSCTSSVVRIDLPKTVHAER